MKFALIGNCSYQALVSDTARIAWLCWPRFDSSFVFGELVAGERGGEFFIAPPEDNFATSQRYRPHTAILETRFQSADGDFEVVDFAPRYLQYERSFRPNMLVRMIRPLTGTPRVKVVCRPTYDYGKTEPGSYIASNHIQWIMPGTQLRLTSNAPLTYVKEGRPFALDRPIYLVLTWGAPLEAPLEETCEAFLARTRRYWQTWVRHCSLPEEFQNEVIRSAITLKLHQFEDTGAITASATTSLPEHPGSERNWDYRYCWLRDSAFTLGALRRLGQFEEMQRFINYLGNIAESGEGRLQPVYGISGERKLEEQILDLPGYNGNGPVRIGNDAYLQAQNDVFGEMLASMAPLFLDVRFDDHARAWSTGLFHRLLDSVEHCFDLPDASLWEKRREPKVHTFTLLMNWAGARAACSVGQRTGDEALAARGQQLLERSETLIASAWREKLGFYADSPESMDADASLFMLVNLGMLPPDHPHAERHILNLAKRLAANSRDYLLYRYLHDDGIGATYATFTVCGFWYAEALARLDKIDHAREAFTGLMSHANHVGLLSEDIDPKSGALWGNFPQTYSHVGLINAAFAISPAHGPLI